MWRHLRLTVLQAEYRTERACELPDYLGSTLRGVFGQELRAVSCVERDGPCAVCTRPDQCASGALFDDQTAGRNGPVLGQTAGEGTHSPSGCSSSDFDRPRPYILDPPPRRRGVYAAGETIRLGVTLAGRARAWYPSVVAALAGIGRRGLGVERRPWSLVRIGAVDSADGLTEIDAAGTGPAVNVPELEAPWIVAAGPPHSPQVIVALVTPADLQQKGRRLDRFDGPTFFRRLIRRVGTIAETYGDPPPDTPACDYHHLAELANQVAVAEQQVSFQSWQRYSNLTETKHGLSGIMGQALFTRVTEPLWPYLILGQWVHLGKGASFGQGRYLVLPQASSGSMRTL